MDELLGALAKSVASAGPEWAAIALFAVLTFWKGVPFAEKVAERAHERDMAREARKAEEAKSRDDFERKSVELQGRWLGQYEHATEVQQQTNAVMGGIQAQMASLNATLADSKDRSRDMAREVHEVHSAVMGGQEKGER